MHGHVMELNGGGLLKGCRASHQSKQSTAPGWAHRQHAMQHCRRSGRQSTPCTARSTQPGAMAPQVSSLTCLPHQGHHCCACFIAPTAGIAGCSAGSTSPDISLTACIKLCRGAGLFAIAFRLHCIIAGPHLTRWLDTLQSLCSCALPPVPALRAAHAAAVLHMPRMYPCQTLSMQSAMTSLPAAWQTPSQSFWPRAHPAMPCCRCRAP